MNPLISLLFAPSLALAAPPPPDWGALGRESAALLSAYLATDTTNPPGNERRGADLLAAYLAADGITADLIDPRTLSPLDDETIYESLENTGRLVIIDESPPRCSVASDIAALVASNAFHTLKAPIVQITAPHTPVPFARELERLYVPSPQAIEAAIRRLVKQ